MDAGIGVGSARLFHPSGVAVTLPLAGSFAEQFAAVGEALAAGFLASPPGVEAGEQKEDVGAVVRREKENQDGTLTPIVDLYPADEQLKFCALSVYLNRDEDVAAFERASGLKLDKLPLYIGQNKIERGKSRQTDALVVRAAKPFAVVFKDNPKYDPAETDTAKKKPKRLFVRWHGAAPAVAPPPRAAGGHKSAYDAAVASMKACEGLDELRAVWETIDRDQFATAELNGLVEVKEERKRALRGSAGPGGQLFEAGSKAAGMPVH